MAEPLMCIKSWRCGGCGTAVHQGSLYFCDGLFQTPLLWILFGGPCKVCGEDHDFLSIEGKDHPFCPALFKNLGDPDEEIKETDEPADAKRVEDDCYDLPVQTPVQEPENV